MTAARLMPVGAGFGFDVLNVLNVCVGTNVVLAVVSFGVGVLDGEAGVITGVVLGVIAGVEIEIEVEGDVVETLTMWTLRSGVAAHWNCT
jgi:hypothetical protein